MGSQRVRHDSATEHTHMYTYFTGIVSVILPAILSDILFYQKDIEVRAFGMDGNMLLYLKWITNTDLLYGTGNLLKVMWQRGWEGVLGENGYVYIYG